jgi:hypothetical protein
MIAGGRWGAFALCLVPFTVLATLNSGGYRYGASDQAFYVPAVLETLDPALFPRDTSLLTAQTKLTLVDETLAAIVTASGMTLPSAFALLYLVALILVAGGTWLVGTTMYRSRWTTVALLAAMTLRHAIARSGTNTLEGYFHPRTLAFGLGAIAVGAFLRQRRLASAAVLLLAFAVHPTTALWFIAWLGAAAMIDDTRLRRLGVPIAILAAIASGWALIAGPLAGRLTPMDPEWLALLESKDYLFPLQWPAYPWIFNLGYLVIIAAIFRIRSAAGLVIPSERALVFGSSILFVIFFAALVGHALKIALSFQLQPARIFWMFDFLATIYVVWAVAEWRPARQTRAALAAASIAALSVVRGAYVVYETDRSVMQPGLPGGDWGAVMAWARSSDKSSGWIADPLHAVLYGTSLRVAGERDVYVESVKDAAIGMYSRDVAVRTRERLEALGAFEGLTVERARAVSARYDMDYLVIDRPLDLPLAFTSGELRVYRLK